MRERLEHAAIRPVQCAFRMRDCDPAVAGVLVDTRIVHKVAARPGVWSRRRLRRPPVGVKLRDEFAPPLAKTIEPGYWLLAAHAVEDIVREGMRSKYRNHRIIGEHRNTDP